MDCHVADSVRNSQKQMKNSRRQALESIPGFLEVAKQALVELYTLAEAVQAVRKLNFRTRKEYKTGYKQDPRLPSEPDVVYKQNGWISWPYFLTGKIKELKYTKEECCVKIKKYRIKTWADYQGWCKKDHRLPHAPQNVYNCSLGELIQLATGACSSRQAAKYTKEECFIKIREHSIRTRKNYHEFCKKDSRMPSNPRKFFGCTFSELLRLATGQCSRRATKKYTEKEFCIKIMEYGIKTQGDYYKWCKKDPSLPYRVQDTYGFSLVELVTLAMGEVPSPMAVKKYTKEECCTKIREYAIKTYEDYEEWRKKDYRLPSQTCVKDSFGCTVVQLIGLAIGECQRRDIRKYTKKQCCDKIKKYGIRTYRDYENSCKKDPCLPSLSTIQSKYNCTFSELLRLATGRCSSRATKKYTQEECMQKRKGI